METQILDIPYYVIFLSSIFDSRKICDPHYSLRAFSRDMNISVGQLSMVMSGKQRLSADHACRIAIFLNLSEDDFYQFVISTVK